MAAEKEYLTAVSICAGIVTLIDYEGMLHEYRQRGIDKLEEQQRRELIRLGLLQRCWESYEEIPRNIVLSYEDPTLYGEASSKYPTAKLIARVFGI